MASYHDHKAIQEWIMSFGEESIDKTPPLEVLNSAYNVLVSIGCLFHADENEVLWNDILDFRIKLRKLMEEIDNA